MTPIKPHWRQPSHPSIQRVVASSADFTTKSFSRVTLSPYAVFAKMTLPPCTIAPKASYDTVQIAADKHLLLNSDLLYINHSCEPSLVFDTENLTILAGPNGLKPEDELTFFYPSTEWEMAQPFLCLCRTSSCREIIAGARDMSPAQLEGYWLNQHIHTLARRRVENDENDRNTDGLREVDETGILDKKAELARSGPTSRALSGEMGGDTSQPQRLGSVSEDCVETDLESPFFP